MKIYRTVPISKAHYNPRTGTFRVKGLTGEYIARDFVLGRQGKILKVKLQGLEK